MLANESPGRTSLGKATRVVAIAQMLWLLSTGAMVAAPQGITPGALAEIRALEQEKAGRTPIQQKLDSSLIYARKKLLTGATSPAAPHLQTGVTMQTGDRVLVDITATVSGDLLTFIENNGGQVINNFPQYNAIRALIPLRDIESLAARSDVRFVERAREPETSACTYTGANFEGDICHRACDARDTYGVDGTGVKVGVLSGSDQYLATAQSNGTLGAVITLPGQSGVPDPNPHPGEGTAMMEIVYRLAPGAQLYFATGGPSPSQMAENILALAAAGCNIIVDDVTYATESPFQDGQPIAQAVHDVSDQGVLFFSSAGNFGNKDTGSSGTWDGDFSDGGAVGFPFTVTNFNGKVETVGRLLNFGGGTNYNTILDSTTTFDLFWTDPLGASTNDYDLFVVGPGGVVGAGTTTQNGTQDPYEVVGGNFIAGYQVVIVKYSGENRFLQLESGHQPQFAGDVALAITTAGRVKGHNCATAQNAFCVAATSVANTETLFGIPFAFAGGAEDPVEPYSDDGPRRLYFYPNGIPTTPGDFSSTGGFVFQKPDITAGDHVYGSAVPGFSPFQGTSAAAPEAAGIAALVLSKNLAQTPLEIRTALQATALDIMTNGVDRNAGYGILMAYPAVGIVLNILALANSWTNSADGKWEVAANWSKGAAPTTAHAGIIISNAPGKTVTIDGVTTNTPSIMTINYLTVSAPEGSTNTLFLNRAGAAMPLTIQNGLVLESNGVMVVDSSRVQDVFGGLVVGNTGGNSTLIITNGGAVNDDGCFVGVGSNATANTLLVAGASSLMYTLGDLGVGWSGSGNRLTISNQAKVLSTEAFIGYNASSTGNNVTVTGGGSTWFNNLSPQAGNLYIGYNGAANTMTITNGGVVNSENAAVGYHSANNTVSVDGSGSVWFNAYSLYVGFSGASNLLTVSGNGSVIASNSYVGFGYTNSANMITVAGGTLFLTAALDVRCGTLTINSGTVSAGSLVASNGANSVIQFNGGTLNCAGAYVTNGQTFSVGNASSVATYHLAGGVHFFSSSLQIRSNAFLTGCGTILGNVTIDPGGTALDDCGGTLTFLGIVINNGTMRAINDSKFEAFGAVVNNGTIDLINGGVTNFHGVFINNGTILTSNDVVIAATSVSGNDVIVKIQSAIGHTYQLQVRDSYQAGDWTDILAAQVGDGSRLTFVDLGGATNYPARFYRIRVSP